MMKHVGKSILPLMGLLCCALPISAASAQEIAVNEDAPYTHKSSGMTFVPQVDEFTRFRVHQYQSGNDLSATYQDKSGKTFATVYVTRVGTPDPYLWFDVVHNMIKGRGGFSPVMEADVQPEFFTAPGFDKESGVQVTYATYGDSVRSSGLAMMAYNDFIVKVRVSSHEYDRDALDKVMERFITDFPMPTPTGNEMPPYTVQDCPDRLKFVPDSKQLKDDMAKANAGAISELFGESLGGLGPSRYCFDSISDDGFRIYRPAASKEGYLLSYSDTGRSVIVGRGGQSILDQSNPDKKMVNYRIVHQLPDLSEIHAPFDKLPPPGAVARAVAETPVIATTDRSGEVTIVTGAK